MRIVTMDPKKCVGCKNCEYACAFNHAGDFHHKNSNMRVNFYPEQRILVPLTCLHCENAWCMEVCPAAAISRDEETGAVVVNEDRCAGCKMCMLSCPYGNIHFDSDKLVSKKCHLCGGEPNCVKHCISGALQFEEVEDRAAANRRNYDACVEKMLKAKNNK